MDNIRKRVGARIKRAREACDITMKAMAKRIGVANDVSVARYESGARQPDFETMERIANVTQKRVSWFFEDEPDDGLDVGTAEVESEPHEPAVDRPLDPAQPVVLDHDRLSALITQAVGNAVSQAQLASEERMAQVMSHAVSEAVAPLQARLTSQAHELARLHKEVREQHRQANRLNDAKYRGCSSTRPTQPPSGAEAAGG